MQFSHFSVKEYLTSARLATSVGDVSRFHIVLEPAHTILAQACIGVLLQPDDDAEENGIRKMSPLAGYAARHWVVHAQFERVSLSLRKAMEYLFDVDKPYFAVWLELYDIDTFPNEGTSSLRYFTVPKSGATPLYYAALCGFEDPVEHLVVKYPQHVDSIGGYYVTPLVAALAGRHFRTAGLLHHDSTDVNVRCNDQQTPLFSAAYYGDLEMVQILLDYKADVNVWDASGWAVMHHATSGFSFIPRNVPQLWPDVTRLLLEHGADVNTLNTNFGRTPLHLAADRGSVDIVHVLLEHDANVGAQDYKGRTALHLAADTNSAQMDGGNIDIVRVLLEHGANVGAQDKEGGTALHLAVAAPLGFSSAGGGSVDIVRMLLEHGANVGVKNNNGDTAFQIASAEGNDEIMELLSEHSAKGEL